MQSTVAALLGLLGIAHPSSAPAQAMALDLTRAPDATVPEAFTSIGAVREVAAGVVILADLLERRLVMADLNAGKVTPVGRQGNGPGEWQMPMAVLPGRNRETYVADPMLNRLHVVSPEGRIVRGLQLPGAAAGGRRSLMVPRAADTLGRIYVTGVPIGGSSQPGDTIPIERFDLRGATPVVDTMAWLPVARTIEMSGSSAGARFTAAAGRPYAAGDDWSVLADGGVAVVRHDPYRLAVYRRGDRPVVGPVVAYTAVPVGKAERDAYRDQQRHSSQLSVMTGRASRGATTSLAPSSVADVADAEFPKVMPPFLPGSAVVATPAGQVWVRRAREAAATTETYDIFDGLTARRLGTATLRRDSRVVGFGAGSVYVARRTAEDDLLHLERYALPSSR